MRPAVLLALTTALLTPLRAEVPQVPGLFPFVLPWDDASPGITDLSGLLAKPAGAAGPVRAGDDGHLYVGAQRLRLFGVDQAYSANFPTHEQAEGVAARLAKFGVNIMRFHIMDDERYPDGLLARNGLNSRDFEPDALDRLDYYTAQLQRHGVYVYLCLLNYRRFMAADGLPQEIEQAGATVQAGHVVGFYDPKLLALQKEYAQRLLTHRNAYTGRTYAEDPAVAFVEINNENGLVHAWLSQTVDRLPAVFQRELAEQWNTWLSRRYAGTAALGAAWNRGAQPVGDEMLSNGDLSHGLDGWSFERHEPAAATAAASDEAPAGQAAKHSVCLDVTAPGTQSWHVRFQQFGLKVQAETAYVLAGWVRADRPGMLHASLEQTHEPWHDLASFGTVPLTAEWQPFRLVTRATETDGVARVVLDPPQQVGRTWVAGLSLRPGGVVGLPQGQSLEAGSVALLPYAHRDERSVDALADFGRFLWETEDAYWQAMNRYLKDDLKVRGLVIGTVVGCSTPNLMAKIGCIDAHAYWEHPSFPNRAWDADDWVVQNRSMVNARGGVLPELARHRVLNKPFCVTEYGEAAPNTHVSEVHLLRAAYASLQDWDYVSASRYAHHADFDRQRIGGFFDIDQHPTSMLALLPAAAMFRRGDVARARQEVVTPLSREQEIGLLPRQHPWSLIDLGAGGTPPEAALIHRVALATEGQAVPADALRPDQVKAGGDRFVSDTGELDWDLRTAEHGVVTVDTPRSKAVIGYGGGRRFVLGQTVIEPGPTVQDGWSVLTLTVMSGDLTAAGPARVLLTATGYVENTGMGWKSAEKNSVGREWGTAPTLVEGVPARVTLPWPAARVQAWVLDERGQRRAPLPCTAGADGRAVLQIGPAQRTLWYEIAAE